MHEFSISGFHAWLQSGTTQLAPLTAVTLLSAWNLDVLRVLDSQLLYWVGFSAPISEYTQKRVMIAGVITTMFEVCDVACTIHATIHHLTAFPPFF